MDRQEIEKLKKAVEEEYQRKTRLIKEERDNKMIAIDLVASIETPEVKPSRAGQISNLVVGRIVNASASNIREAIENASGDFSIRTIREYIENQTENASISRNSFHSVVKSMLRDNKIELISEGAGKRAALYKKITPSETAVEKTQEGVREMMEELSGPQKETGEV